MVIDKGTRLMHTRINKALYEFLHSPLIFDIKLVTDLKNYGFKLNPYDTCVTKKC